MDHEKRIDKSIPFIAVNIAILTVSDSRRLTDDKSGDLLAGRVAPASPRQPGGRLPPPDVSRAGSSKTKVVVSEPLFLLLCK